MGVEIATTIDGLNQNWPLGTDSKSEGDDHLRMIKTVILAALGDDGTKITIKRPLTATGTLTATAVKTDWLSKTGVDMALGFRAAGTPAASRDRLVINDTVDGSGADRLVLDDTGSLTIANLFASGSVNGVTGIFSSTVQAAQMQAPGNLVVQAGGSGAVYIRPSPGTVTPGTSDLLVANASMVMQGRINARVGYAVQFGANAAAGGNVFNIHWTGGSAAYMIIDNTNIGQFTFTSDYRTKKDVVELADMWETVLALKPICYTQAAFDPTGTNPDNPMFPSDEIERWGFMAHELQETLTMTAASGTKDCYQEIQSPNPWTVLAAVTCALQEAMRRIEELEAMVVP